MFIKVCGINNKENLIKLAKLPVDYVGFIFYDKSPRNCTLQPEDLAFLRENQQRVGVFVNEKTERILELAKTYKLSVIQLHGEESNTDCMKIQNADMKVFKSISVNDKFNSDGLSNYGHLNHFLLDTKGKHRGGNGHKFDWNILKDFPINYSFILSGGITPDDADSIKELQQKHSSMAGIDINSCFETSPGVKDMKQVELFVKSIKNEL